MHVVLNDFLVAPSQPALKLEPREQVQPAKSIAATSMRIEMRAERVA
jgi:hypothetical protein